MMLNDADRCWMMLNDAEWLLLIKQEPHDRSVLFSIDADDEKSVMIEDELALDTIGYDPSLTIATSPKSLTV